MSDAKDFALRLDREWLEKQDDMAETVATIGLTALNSIVMKSPVGNPSLWKTPRKGYVGGMFRANWFTTIGAPTDAATQDVDPSGQSSISRGVSVLGGYTQDLPPIFIQNNLPYAIPLENGHSKGQAPAGMVAVTVAEIEARFDGKEI